MGGVVTTTRGTLLRPLTQRVHTQDEGGLSRAVLGSQGKSQPTSEEHANVLEKTEVPSPTHHVPHVGPNGIVEIERVASCLPLDPALHFLLLEPFYLPESNVDIIYFKGVMFAQVKYSLCKPDNPSVSPGTDIKSQTQCNGSYL